MSYLNKEANRTEPSPSVSVPFPGDNFHASLLIVRAYQKHYGLCAFVQESVSD